MRHFRLLAWVALLVLVLGTVPAQAGNQRPPIFWTVVQPGGAPGDFAQGNGLYIMLGERSTIFRSEDGRQWVEIPTPPGLYLRKIVFFQGEFWAFGSDGFYTSPDGSRWRQVEAGQRGWALQLVVAGPDLYLLTDVGVYHRTADATWQLELDGHFSTIAVTESGLGVAIPTLTELRAVWVATGTGEWTRTPTPDGGRPINVVAGRDQILLAVDDQTSNRGSGLYSNRDGRTWQPWRVPAKGLEFRLMLWHEDRFWLPAPRQDGPGDLPVYTTPDGEGWERPVYSLPPALPFQVQFRSVGGKLWLATNRELYTLAPEGYQRSFTTADLRLKGLAGGANRWVAVSEQGELVTSADGWSWSTVPMGATAIAGTVRWSGGRFTLLGRPTGCQAVCNPVVLHSADGLQWARWEVPKPTVDQVLWANGQAVVRSESQVGTSADGQTWRWTEYGSLGGDPLVFFAGAYYRLQHVKGFRVERSVDLENWTTVNLGISTNYYATLSAGEGRLVVGLSDGSFVTSTDGQKWVFYLPASGPVQAEGPFLLTGGALSRDGTTFYEQPWGRPSPSELGGKAAWNGSALLARGPNGELFTYRPPAGESLTCQPRFMDQSDRDAACDAINWGAAAGFLKGVAERRFSPDVPVTRASFAMMLVDAQGWPVQPQTALPFTDVAGTVAAGGYLQAAVARGVMGGYPDGRFYPDRLLTRAEALKILTATIGGAPAVGMPYLDAVDTWYSGWGSAARLSRLVGPTAAIPIWDASTLEPGRLVTRAEVAILLFNLSHRLLRVGT